MEYSQCWHEKILYSAVYNYAKKCDLATVKIRIQIVYTGTNEKVLEPLDLVKKTFRSGI